MHIINSHAFLLCSFLYIPLHFYNLATTFSEPFLKKSAPNKYSVMALTANFIHICTDGMIPSISSCLAIAIDMYIGFNDIKNCNDADNFSG